MNGGFAVFGGHSDFILVGIPTFAFVLKIDHLIAPRIVLWVETAETKGIAVPPATYAPVPVSRPPLALRPFRVEDYLGTMADAVYYLAVSVHEDSATELIESVKLVGRSAGGKLLAAALGDAESG